MSKFNSDGVQDSSKIFSFADDLIIATSALIEEKVFVNVESHFPDLGRAFAHELLRANRDRYLSIEDMVRTDQILNPDPDFSLTFEEHLANYAAALLMIRLESIQDKGCPFWRSAKNLLMSATIQAAISSVGKFNDTDRGRLLIPVAKKEYVYDIAKLLRISNYLQSFKVDGIRMFEDAFPRTKYVDNDVMNCLMKTADGQTEAQVFSVSKLTHPSDAFIAFLLDLTSETSNSIYCIPYGYESRLREYIWRYLW